VGHRYTVEFRVFSETLDPATITRELGLQPCQVRIHGTPRFGGKSTFTGMWAFNGTDESAGKTEWTSLEEGLAYVLGRLWPLRETIEKYAANADLIWWCGHFQDSFDGGPQLSPSLLSRLGEFGAALYIDNYFPEPAK
jgi:hypothetical protein